MENSFIDREVPRKESAWEAVQSEEGLEVAQQILEVAREASPFLRESKPTIDQISKRFVEDYQYDRQFTEMVGSALTIGLTVARLRERGAEKRAIEAEERLLAKCGQLKQELKWRYSSSINIEEQDLQESAIQIALAIQRLKNRPSKKKTGEESGTAETKKKGIVSVVGKSIARWIGGVKGDLEPGCAAGLVLFLLFAGSTGALAVQSWRASRGEMPFARQSQEEKAATTLKETDFNRIISTLKLTDPSIDAYLNEVWAIFPDDLAEWREDHPQASEEEMRRFADELIRDKDPNNLEGYVVWYSKVWAPQATPQP